MSKKTRQNSKKKLGSEARNIFKSGVGVSVSLQPSHYLLKPKAAL